ncbi:MAG: cobalt-precorrin-5B (C(1))-methyltransferase CbiD [Calditerrivibrio sp.]|nr:cobalt-precorrin-5B (C(1))-methyltransferase CbiD [Calditerrivibrio sp.]
MYPTNGITTGTAATAAAKAILLKKLNNKIPSNVEVTLPDGQVIDVPVQFKGDYAICKKWSIEKDDITNGLEIMAQAYLNNNGTINIIGGKGIGTVTKKGLQLPVGEKAINPGPKRMIIKNIAPLLHSNIGVDIYLEVPNGEEIAKKTFNSRLGIIGGISIIGTKGVINPMSEEAIKETIRCEIEIKKHETDLFVLTPGNIGEKALRLLGFTEAIMVNNHFDFALSHLRSIHATKIVLGGHPGKLAKLASGTYNTHSKYGINAVDIIKSIMDLKDPFNTAEQIAQIHDLSKVAFCISQRVKRDFDFVKVDVYLHKMDTTPCGRYIDE